MSEKTDKFNAELIANLRGALADGIRNKEWFWETLDELVDEFVSASERGAPMLWIESGGDVEVGVYVGGDYIDIEKAGKWHVPYTEDYPAESVAQREEAADYARSMRALIARLTEMAESLERMAEQNGAGT